MKLRRCWTKSTTVSDIAYQLPAWVKVSFCDELRLVSKQQKFTEFIKPLEIVMYLLEEQNSV